MSCCAVAATSPAAEREMLAGERNFFSTSAAFRRYERKILPVSPLLS